MYCPLSDASAGTCGGKAATLGALLRAGFPVPGGFVVPFALHRAASAVAGRKRLSTTLRAALEHRLSEMGHPPVAVRSSAADEDTAGASAAGVYESVIGVHGTDAVARAVETCWASLAGEKVASYRGREAGASPHYETGMAVLVQRLIDADVSGVMFTPASVDDATRIEAAWGLGLGVVGGTVTPDTHDVTPDGRVHSTPGHKTTRLDRAPEGTGVVAHDLPKSQRTALALDDDRARTLAELGHRIAAFLGGPQDIEWAITAGRVWLLQSRPITAALPRPARTVRDDGDDRLRGAPGSRGTATGTARILLGPDDFARVRPGDIAVCRFTDPSWTPLFRMVAGIVTETGGTLCHAAIVAREHGIPAAIGVRHAMTRIRDGEPVSVNGTEGIVIRVPDGDPRATRRGGSPP